ncbi:MAG TPA: HEAT repeat domain-containing protein [Candidatus Sulfotelmatobacter sp.]|nr:HEAT repeat domain-containing protein [Candidatus Sulfotelmatobacter sp.]
MNRMQQEQHGNKSAETCEGFGPRWTLFAAGELDAAEIAELNDHLLHCANCNATLAQENALLALLSTNHREPDAALLAGCRASLEDALDQEEEHGWLRRAISTWMPGSWISPAPAWSAALLLLIGFSVGILGPRYLKHSVTPNSASQSGTSTSGTTTSTLPEVASPDDPATSSLSALDLHTANVAGINVFPSGNNQPPQVELQLRAQQPITVQGTVNDDQVKRVLMYFLRNSQRFDPDARMNAVELLRARNNDEDVRAVLCQTVHTDPNAAVRLKALEALDGAEPQDIIQQTLLDALVDDQNPGVRVEAINALREMAAKGQVESDDHLLSVLRRMQKDPSTYIRLQSAAAIRDLGPRQKF